MSLKQTADTAAELLTGYVNNLKDNEDVFSSLPSFRVGRASIVVMLQLKHQPSRRVSLDPGEASHCVKGPTSDRSSSAALLSHELRMMITGP